MKALFILTASLLIEAASFAGVVGEPVERLGTNWESSDFQDWLENEIALITPESSNLALQYCLRTTQEALDGPAYDLVAKPLLNEMNARFGGRRRPVNEVDAGLMELTQLLNKINQLTNSGEIKSPREYTSMCTKTVGDTLKNAKNIFVVYEGRMNPTRSENLPETIRQKLDELAKRGVQVAPLKVPGLIEQICKLEGYYSTSWDPRLWRLFSITRAMSNVLLNGEKDALFVGLMAQHPALAAHIGTLNRYSAVAGKSNGLSIGMTEREAILASKSTPVRLTGPALGSASTALMAFYTTAWREQLQEHVLQEGYPQKPFRLISADQTLKAIQKTDTEVEQLHVGDRAPSQTEEGMRVVWGSILGWHLPSVRPFPVYGSETLRYKNTAALAWLALNAETNIRQNEKIAGLERTSLPSDQRVTQNVFADSSAYGAMVREIDAALSAYRHIDQDGSLVENTCVMPVRKFAEAAHAASKAKDNSVVQLEKAETAVFGKVEFKKAFEFKPVIADIGSEVLDDPEGFQGETQFEEFKGQKNFKLHLATGYFRQVPITIGIGTRKKLYLIGTPSAFVIHFAGTTSTAEWQQGLVERYDSRE